LKGYNLWLEESSGVEEGRGIVCHSVFVVIVFFSGYFFVHEGWQLMIIGITISRYPQKCNKIYYHAVTNKWMLAKPSSPWHHDENVTIRTAHQYWTYCLPILDILLLPPYASQTCV